jgi:hypothetical protein
MRSKALAALLCLVAVLVWLGAAPAVWAQEGQEAAGAAAETATPVDASLYATDQVPEKMRQAIRASLEEEDWAARTTRVLEPGQPEGYLGLAGAPQTAWWAGLLWAILVGWVFSTVGAFGGILSGVGHITIFGLGDYAAKFGKGSPVNNLLTDSIRVSNQWLVGFSGLISSINYYKMGRLVLPLGACLAIGGVGGSWLVPELTAGQISLKDYIGWFGVIVLILGFFLLYQISPKGQASKQQAKAAAQAFEKAAKSGGDTSEQGVKILEGKSSMMWLGLVLVVASALWNNLVGGMVWIGYILLLAGWLCAFLIGEIRFTFYGQEFRFKAWIPMAGGIFIAAIASFLGIGGGFLFVPFLTSVAGLPMFIVAGTSALVVLIGMIVSIFSYMVGKGVLISWGLVGAELVGIFIGSMIGPRTSKFIPEKGLKIIFIILAFGVGIRYTLKGFFPEFYAGTGLP